MESSLENEAELCRLQQLKKKTILTMQKEVAALEKQAKNTVKNIDKE